MFERKPDYIRLVSTISKDAFIVDKESSSQRRMLEDLQKSVVPELNPEMQEFTKIDDVDNQTLQKYIMSYLKYIISE